MISRFSRLLSILILVAVAVYIVIVNRETATFTLGGSWSTSANLGVLLLSSFSFGILVASIVALFFGFRSWLRERKLYSIDRQRQSFIEGLIKARSISASHEWRKARDYWLSLSRKDPSDIIAQIEISRSLENSGELSEALRAIETVRSSHPENIEVLFRAFELQKQLGNSTAALDNLALILGKQPCLRAASEARTLSENLGRIADALEYHEQCISLGEHPDISSPIEMSLQFKLLLQSASKKEPDIFNRELQGFFFSFCQSNHPVWRIFITGF